MYLSIRQLAVREGCSERTILRNVHKMEASGRYPNAVKMVGGLKVDAKAFDAFTTRERFEKVRENGRKDEFDSDRNDTTGNADVIDISGRMAATS